MMMDSKSDWKQVLMDAGVRIFDANGIMRGTFLKKGGGIKYILDGGCKNEKTRLCACLIIALCLSDKRNLNSMLKIKFNSVIAKTVMFCNNKKYNVDLNEDPGDDAWIYQLVDDVGTLNIESIFIFDVDADKNKEKEDPLDKPYIKDLSIVFEDCIKPLGVAETLLVNNNNNEWIAISKTADGVVWIYNPTLIDKSETTSQKTRPFSVLWKEYAHDLFITHTNFRVVNLGIMSSILT